MDSENGFSPLDHTATALAGRAAADGCDSQRVWSPNVPAADDVCTYVHITETKRWSRGGTAAPILGERALSLSLVSTLSRLGGQSRRAFPQKPTSRLQRPWIHEIKHDGFRIVARKNGERVRLAVAVARAVARAAPIEQVVDANLHHLDVSVALGERVTGEE